jgi:dynein heavy chain, axonemal
VGQPDIPQLLPKESSQFDKVNKLFKQEMQRIAKERKCYEALILSHASPDAFLKILRKQHEILEDIKKHLNQFLDGKRLSFPRFFFMTNDDLLEIIGQARDPAPVNRHIGKIFEGVKEVMCPPPTGNKNSKVYTITKVKSPDDEELDFGSSTLTISGKVEDWMKRLQEEIIKETLQKLFHTHHQSMISQGKQKSDKDKLQQIKQGKGQVLLTYAMIEWTR